MFDDKVKNVDVQIGSINSIVAYIASVVYLEHETIIVSNKTSWYTGANLHHAIILCGYPLIGIDWEALLGGVDCQQH